MQGGETDALEGRFMEEQVFVVSVLMNPKFLSVNFLIVPSAISAFPVVIDSTPDCRQRL